MTQRVAGGPVDFDLHGAVGVRLIGATSADANAVRRQLGPIERPFDRPPDIEIEYVERIQPDGPLRAIGRDDAAFDRSSLVILRGRFKASVRVAIPFDRVGGPCRIVAERGVGPIPLLVPMVNLTALGRGLLPIHASAFVHDGLGVLVTGWAKGGKSEVLLAFAARGAAYVGDEWVYLADDGSRMVGLPEPIRLWDWQLRAMPEFAARVPRGQRLRLASTRAVGAVVGGTAEAPIIRRTAGGRTPPAAAAVRRPPARRPGPAGPAVRWPGPGRGRARSIGSCSWRAPTSRGRSSSRSPAARSPGAWSTRSGTSGSTCGRPT